MKKAKLKSVKVEAVQPPPVPPSLLDPSWKYTPSSATNVLQRFKAMGWVPPSEVKKECTNA